MSKFRTHYDNLQVTENASIEVIRGAYKYLSQKWHPDKHFNDKKGATRYMKMINDAYLILSDPEKRRQHDEWIRAKRTQYREEPPSDDRTNEDREYKREQKVDKDTQERDLSSEENTQFNGDEFHPWRRFFARSFDVVTGGLIVYIIFSLFLGSVFPENSISIYKVMRNEFIAGVMLFALWIPFEAIFLSTVSTTPAKWVFGIRILKDDGSKLSFSEAMSRSFLVWVKGIGFGIPIVTIFTHYFAYKRLRETGATLWDTSVNTIVMHQKWGWVRVISVIVLFSFSSIVTSVLV